MTWTADSASNAASWVPDSSRSTNAWTSLTPSNTTTAHNASRFILVTGSADARGEIDFWPVIRSFGAGFVITTVDPLFILTSGDTLL